MKSLRIAVVGLGYFSRFHLDAWSRIERARLVAVADRDARRVDAAAQEYDVEGHDGIGALLEAGVPDILDIVTPPETHAVFIRRALAAGCRTIICQKPFCGSLEEAQAVTREAESAGATLVVHENFRFQPWYREIKRQLSAGRIGPVYGCRFALRPGDGQGPDAYCDRQPAFRTMERFLIHETGVHFLDLFRWLFGEIASVFADLRRLNPAVAGEDAGILLLRHASGVRSVFDGNRLVDHVATDRRKTMGEMLIEGEQGVLRLDGAGRLFFRHFAGNTEETVPFSCEDRGFGGGCVEALNRHVVAHLLDGAPVENAARDYLPVIALDTAAYESARSGRIVSIASRGDRR